MSALSLEFESDLRSIYSRSRTLDEVTREIAALRDKIAERRDAYEKEYERTSQIIESRFDEDVRRVFKRLREELPAGLVQLDRDIADLVDGYLALARRRLPAFRRGWPGACSTSRPDADLPAEVGDGRRFATGDARGLTDAEPLNLVASAGSRRDRGCSRVAGRVGRVVAARRRVAGSRGAGGTRPACSRWRWSTTPASSRFSDWSPAAVVDGAPIDPSLAAQIARLQATDGRHARRHRRSAVAR